MPNTHPITPVRTTYGWHPTGELRWVQLRDCAGVPTMRVLQQKWAPTHVIGPAVELVEEWRDVPQIDEVQKER